MTPREDALARSHTPNLTALAADRERALKLVHVSRETWTRLDAMVQLLVRWQKTINLIAPSTLESIWTRHVLDSFQVHDVSPEAKTWVDYGSGGGFPGLVIACALAEQPGAVVHLVESNAKKAAFLREAIRLTRAPAKVHATRLENVVESLAGHTDIVTARAVAPLKQLLDACAPLLLRGAIGLFPKGQDVEDELTTASTSWAFDVTLIPSRTDPKSRIVKIQHLAPRGSAR